MNTPVDPDSDEPSEDTSTPDEQELESQVSGFLSRMDPNCTSGVQVRIWEGKEILAFALGGKVGTHVFGKIEIRGGLLDLLDEDELKFVLGHEAGHLFLNHSFSKIPKEIVRLLGKEDGTFAAIGAALDLIEIGKLILEGESSEGRITKEQEVQADIQSILATGNKTAALSCLTKLAGGDLKTVSHNWEALGIELPAMTMEERLRLVRQKIADYEAQEYRFD